MSIREHRRHTVVLVLKNSYVIGKIGKLYCSLYDTPSFSICSLKQRKDAFFMANLVIEDKTKSTIKATNKIRNTLFKRHCIGMRKPTKRKSKTKRTYQTVMNEFMTF